MSNEVGNSLRKARLAKGYTLREVMERMNVKTSEATIWRIENGSLSLKEVERFVSLGSALDLSASQIVDLFAKAQKSKRKK